MSIIEIKSLSKIYREADTEIKAVNNISLTIEKGEFVAIVGPSGSGKTTLLNMIGGLDTPTHGEIIINGENITRKSLSQLVDFRLKSIGFVFQAYNLIPVLTAKENVEFIMSLQGISPKKRSERALKLLNEIGLGDRVNYRPSKLSGGQQQRVAVARALAPHPQFILADEPTANLDHESASTLLNIMEKLNMEEQATFIFSTHDERVMKKARRIVTLSDGVIESDTDYK